MKITKESLLKIVKEVVTEYGGTEADYDRANQPREIEKIIGQALTAVDALGDGDLIDETIQALKVLLNKVQQKRKYTWE